MYERGDEIISVGMPVISPVSVLKLNPAGNAPDVRAYFIGLLPPLALTGMSAGDMAEYSVKTLVARSTLAVSAAAPDESVMLNDVCADCFVGNAKFPLSLKVTVKL